ncbi:MAG: MOSC domain-containing protein [Candidatus Eremiobacteraeota bacterium]|nr:MOSC domain-containing protein [Candidatus Eremiobacteraeota bacterium]
MRITGLFRFPVKSMAGQSLERVEIGRGGMPQDRRFVIIDGQGTRAGKPLTARLVGDLLAYRAWSDNGRVYVDAPDGTRYEPGAALADALGASLHRPISIAEMPAGEPMHDAHDLLVICVPSLRALEAEWSKPLNPLRFRPNIILDGDDLATYTEDGWAGKRFAAGDTRIAGVKRNERCVLPTIDPQTLQHDPSLLRLIVERHQKCFGLYCHVEQAGNIAVGDEWKML